MPLPSTNLNKLVLAAVIALALVALAFTVLAPGFSLDSALVYRGF